MPLKLDLSQFSLNQFRSYARFDNGQEEKLRSALDHHFAVERLVCALETAIKHRPGILIGGVPIGESTDGRIVFQITCMHKIENGVACDDFFTAVCHRESVEEFCAELEEQYQRSAGIYLSALDPKLTKKRAVRLHHRRGTNVVSPNGLPVKCVDRTISLGQPVRDWQARYQRRSHSEISRLVFDGTEPRKIGRYIVDPRRLRDHIHELRGFNLACCRPGLPCHADFLLEQANQPKPTLRGGKET